MKYYFRIVIILIVLVINQISSQQLQIDKICQTGLREDNTNYIYCARQNLLRIPNNVGISNIVYDELVLSDNLIETIENNTFSSNFKVKKLYLDHNPLRHIDQAAFDYIRNYLEELYLEQKQVKLLIDEDYEDFNSHQNNNNNNNKYDLDLFDKAIFQKCFNLHLFSLKAYKIVQLKAGLFARMTKLETLILANNRIKYVNEAAFIGLDQLNNLNLDSNYLESVPSEALSQLKKLKRLSLSQNRVKLLSANSFQYSSLVMLDLSYNYLSRLDENAFNGPIQNSIRSLFLQNNELKWQHLNSILFNLHVLQELNLDFNKLGHSSIIKINEFNRRTASTNVYLPLNSMSLQGNGFTDLNIFTDDYFAAINASSTSTSLFNSQIFSFSNLFKLNLARNKLTQIPEQFFIRTNMTNLKTLILEKNPFHNNTEQMHFNGLESSLLTLNLNQVGFNLYSLESLANLKNLQTLKLNGNIMKIKKSTTSQLNKSVLTSLTSLELQNNNLKELPEYLCTSLRNLTDLDLSSNMLTSFSLDCLLFRQPDLSIKLKQLNLNNNPLKCDCNLRKLKIWLMRNYEKDFLDLIRWQCTEPTDLNGRYFANVDLNELNCHLNDLTTTTRKAISSTTTTKTTTTTTTSTTSTTSNSTMKKFQTVTINKILNYKKESITNQLNFDSYDPYTLILIAIAFGLLLICALVLAMFYISCIRNSSRSTRNKNKKFKSLNKYEHQNHRFCSPSSSTSTTSSNKNNDSFSRNSQLTLLSSSDIVLKINKPSCSPPLLLNNNNENSIGYSYYDKNLKDLTFFQIIEEPRNSQPVQPPTPPIYTIETSNSDNHIYHEINTPIKYSNNNNSCLLNNQHEVSQLYGTNFNYFIFPQQQEHLTLRSERGRYLTNGLIV